MMTIIRRLALVAAVGLALSLPHAGAMAQKRDTILVTGSSTVNPFTVAVSKQFAETGMLAKLGGQPPQISSTGTVRGYNLFCQGSGTRYPDIQNASRRMNSIEFSLCVKNGVNEIMEIPIGYDGIVLVYHKDGGTVRLTRAQVWLAIAKEVPKNSTLVPNPHTSWKQIDASLPDWPIQVLGPPPTSGTRDSFTDLLMVPACQTFDEIRSLKDVARQRTVCTTVRTDGKWVDSGEDDAKIVGRIESAPPGIVGVFGYSFLEENSAKLTGATLEGVPPTEEGIASGRYPLARPLFIYAKRKNIAFVAGLKEFLNLYVSTAAMGPDGFLVKQGLVPLEKARQERLREAVGVQAIMLRGPE
jgi:phosphate transport system substrate-binding protein